MPIFNEHQRELAERITDEDVVVGKWKDWKWQLKHAVKDIDTLQALLQVEFSEEELKTLNETTEKFPLSVTPYYLSLIDVDDFSSIVL